MRILFDLFLDICLFRKGPRDVPASMALLKMCLLAYGASGLLVLTLSVPVQVALLQILLDMVLLAGLLYLMLILHRHPGRFEQTLTALTGSGTLMGLLALPPMLWIVRLCAMPSTPRSGSVRFTPWAIPFYPGRSPAGSAETLQHCTVPHP